MRRWGLPVGGRGLPYLLHGCRREPRGAGQDRLACSCLQMAARRILRPRSPWALENQVDARQRRP
jgi:hypothetical protein